MSFLLSDYDYAFPKELIAQHPLAERSHARMMVLDRSQKKWEHQTISDLSHYLREGDVLILNDALADLVPFEDALVPPLPPYIKRKKKTDFTQEDFDRYRSVYAKTPGSKAAPTAGFHFTQDILNALQKKGVLIGFVTLHVDYDTYKPIRNDDIREHPMHGERYEIPKTTLDMVLKAKKENRRVIAVGTTSVRVLESWAQDPSQNTTHLFITPGYSFKIVDAMLTNFHRPRSTVLVMVAAFAGLDFIKASYQEALQEKYRLFSYGDCMFIF